MNAQELLKHMNDFSKSTEHITDSDLRDLSHACTLLDEAVIDELIKRSEKNKKTAEDRTKTEPLGYTFGRDFKSTD